MIPMDKVVDTFKYPQDSHHCEQLAVETLEIVKMYQTCFQCFWQTENNFRSFSQNNYSIDCDSQAEFKEI